MLAQSYWLQGVRSIEYQGLDSPYRSLEENGLLFNPHSRFGGAVNGSFYVFFF